MIWKEGGIIFVQVHVPLCIGSQSVMNVIMIKLLLTMMEGSGEAEVMVGLNIGLPLRIPPGVWEEVHHIMEESFLSQVMVMLSHSIQKENA